jgi:predicted translation initiation factor SUI1
MPKRVEKCILFLCTGNYYRSRFAEVLFNSVAAKMGLTWRADSRALALERGVNNHGPMAKSAVETLERMGISASAATSRFPVQVGTDDFEKSHVIVALKHAEHLPLLQERHPTWIEKVEFWNVDDAPGALAVIEREIMRLTARLIGGTDRPEPLEHDAPVEETSFLARKESPKTSAVVRVGRETKGRRGKGVTVVSDVPLGEAELLELAAKLKQRCGTGGTVKDGRIEIQGDQRDRLVAELERLGYRVKRAGG